MILVGDLARLPPVGQTDSPAMNPDRLKSIGTTLSAFLLTNLPDRQPTPEYYTMPQ